MRGSYISLEEVDMGCRNLELHANALCKNFATKPAAPRIEVSYCIRAQLEVAIQSALLWQ